MTIIGWGRPLGYEPEVFHAVVAIGGGSYVTACAGRWYATAPTDYVEGAEPELDGARCFRCALIARRGRSAA